MRPAAGRPDRAGAPARRWYCGRERWTAWGSTLRCLEALNPGLVVVRISDFGQHGPLRDRDATPLTVQAASGWVNNRDPDRPPVQAGAQDLRVRRRGLRRARRAHRVEDAVRQHRSLVEVDVSVLESLLSTLPYPMLMAEKMRSLGLPANTRSAPMMGIVRAADGWLGINCLTGQHWLDACAMLGLPEYGEQQIAIMLGGPERAEFFEKAQPWLSERTVAEIVELSQAMRIPASPVNDGATVVGLPAVPSIAGSSSMPAATTGRSAGRAPRSACRRRPVLPPRPAPRLGAIRPYRCDEVDWPSRVAAGADPSLPFADMKVLDLTTFWAGAYLTCYLGAFGADDREGGVDPTARRASAIRVRGPTRVTVGMSAAQCGRAPTSTSATSHWISRPIRAATSSAGSSATPTSSWRTSRRG